MNKNKSETRAHSSLNDVSNLNQELLRELLLLFDDKDNVRFRNFVSKLHPSELADLLESTHSSVRLELWDNLEVSVRGQVLSEVSGGVLNALLKEMDPKELVSETSSLDTDELADIIQELPDDFAEEVMFSMTEQNRSRVAEALIYPPDSAGGIMSVDLVTIRGDVDVDVILRFIRRYAPIPDKLNQLFVVDRENVLLGTVTLNALVIADPEISVANLMNNIDTPIGVETSISEVVMLFEKYDLISAPVVDAGNKLIGFISVDDVVDVLREETDRTIMSSAGISDDYDMFASLAVASRQRGLWLAVNLGTAILAAFVIGLFEATLEKMVAIAILMPVVASMGGIAGTQTLTIVVRGLALGKVGPANSWLVMSREIILSLINGCLWAFVVSAVAIYWFDNIKLGIVVGFAMVVNLITAGFSGVAIPLLLKKSGIDPALAGGVILTTVTDVVGFVAFLGLSSRFLV